MTNQVQSLPVEIASKVTTTTQKKLSGDRAVTSLVDTLHKAKIPSTHLISPKPKGDKPSQSTASQQWFDEFNTAIVLGFSSTTQKIMAAPTKSLTEAQKLSKRYWQQQVGAIRGDYKKSLEKREKIGQEIAEGGTPSRVRSDGQRIADNLQDCTKVIENSEGIPCSHADVEFVDLEALYDAVQACKRVLHGVKH